MEYIDGDDYDAQLIEFKNPLDEPAINLSRPHQPTYRKSLIDDLPFDQVPTPGESRFSEFDSSSNIVVPSAEPKQGDKKFSKNLQQQSSVVFSSLWTEKIKVTWKDLSYTVKMPNGTDSQVLKSCTGYAFPGQTLYIMGASGAGKTSLLNVIADRILLKKGSILTGHVTVND